MHKGFSEYCPTKDEMPVTIKIRVHNGCFHREHSPAAYAIIDKKLLAIPFEERHFDLVEHESGPEIIVWIALGTAGITLSKSIVDLVTANINARAKGREAGDRPDGKLLLIIRDTHRTDSSTEEFVMEIYDKEVVSPTQIKDVFEKSIQKRSKKR